MKTLRDTCDPLKLQAHGVLDNARAGQPVRESDVTWALRVLGEPAA